jgi:predicted adenine nucleotide alpha hydrolase (AANH) superfamily ATPase
VEALGREYDVTLFFSNSNLWPEEEYRRRLAAARELARRCGAPFVEDAPDHAAWRRHVAGLEREPERGRRCEACFEFSLARAARFAAQNGFDLFTTTLTISPHKDTRRIHAIGLRLGPFLTVDLKKKDGFRRSVALSKAFGLYRQNYCGCEFSA